MASVDATGSAAEPIEWLRPTGGRVLGYLGLGLAVLGLGLAVADHADYSWPVGFGALLFGGLIWASMLRPRVGLTQTTLVLRQMFETVRLPLAAVEELAVRQVLALRVGDRRLVSSALGRSWRSLAKGPGAAEATAQPAKLSERNYVDVAEERLRARVDQARAAAGVRRGSPEQEALAGDVRRQPAWLEIAVVLVGAVGLLVTLL